MMENKILQELKNIRDDSYQSKDKKKKKHDANVLWKCLEMTRNAKKDDDKYLRTHQSSCPR